MLPQAISHVETTTVLVLQQTQYPNLLQARQRKASTKKRGPVSTHPTIPQICSWSTSQSPRAGVIILHIIEFDAADVHRLYLRLCADRSTHSKACQARLSADRLMHLTRLPDSCWAICACRFALRW